jgi:glutathione S-transferase
MNQVLTDESYQLFKYDSCPFCYRVRKYLESNGIAVPVRDIHTEPGAVEELVAGGGRSTVPCLRIERDGEVEWLYESLDIMIYFRDRYGL